MMSSAATLKRSVILLLSLCLLIGTSQAELQEIQGSEIEAFTSSSRYVLLLFKTSSGCPECDQAASQVDEVPQPELLNTAIEKRFTVDHSAGEKYGLKDFPAVLFFRNGVPAVYDGQKIEVQELYSWLEIALEVAMKELFDDSFEHLTQAASGATTGDWLVLFYKPGCEECQQVLPAFESTGIRVRHKLNVAKVDIGANTKLAERFKMTDCPSAILFRQGKMYLYEPRKFDAKSLVSFVESWYLNVKSQPVPRELTGFDRLTDSIASYIRQQVNNPERKWLFVAAVAAVVTVVIAIVAMVFCKNPDLDRKKYD